MKRKTLDAALKKLPPLLIFVLLSVQGVPSLSQAGANVVVLGIDGMDPHLLEKFVAKGRMPHFRALMEGGSYAHLGTSVPPQSPVAWSNFITGMDPSGHGVFDFIHRDPGNYLPYLSTSSIEEPKRALKLGKWVIPLSRGRATLLRKGEAFWQVLDRNGIPCTVLRIPANFPPVDCGAKSLSGMGTPDLLGTYGTFSFFTDDTSYHSLDVSGGKIYPVSVEGGKVETELTGPENSFLSERPHLKLPLVVYIDRENRLAKIAAGKSQVILKEGEWSEWIEIPFRALGPLFTVHGISRFYLKSVEPTFCLYVSPINLDPTRPALPLSTPASYAAEVCKGIGFFYTQGMPEDTKALEWGMLSESEFIRQARIVLEERLRMLDFALESYRGGLLFFYFSTLDQTTHMLWRNMDPDHPAHTEESAACAGAIEDFYADMDSVLGVVSKRIPEDAALVVMSDHGFAPFYKKFHLNTWLYKNGYLSVRDPSRIEEVRLLANVLWSKTRAYGFGINGLYVNLSGREKKGIVQKDGEYEGLLQEITEKLLALRDPETGSTVVSRVYRPRDFYQTRELQDAPDLIIGYHRGYRCSDQSALGNLTEEVITENTSKWSGDHCMAAEEVPGVLLSNRDLIYSDPTLTDLPGTILSLFGIDKTPEMVGRVIFAGNARSNRKESENVGTKDKAR